MTTKATSQQSFDDTGWVPVPSGTISQCARQKRIRTRLRQMSVAAGFCLVLALGIGVGIFAGRPWGQPATIDLNYGGITCTEVRRLLPMMMEMREIPEPQRSRMQAHLAECPHCRELRDQMMPPTAARQVSGVEQFNGFNPRDLRLFASSEF